MTPFCMVRVHEGIDVGKVLSDSLRECAMQHKEAWLVCEVDGAGWSRSLKGEQPLDLWKLRQLPIRFWHVFLPKLASALIQAWFEEACGDRRMVRAELRESDKEKRA